MVENVLIRVEVYVVADKVDNSGNVYIDAMVTMILDADGMSAYRYLRAKHCCKKRAVLACEIVYFGDHDSLLCWTSIKIQKIEIREPLSSRSMYA